MLSCPLCQYLPCSLFYQDKKRSYFRCARCALIFADSRSQLPPQALKQRFSQPTPSEKQRQLANFVLPLLDQLHQLTASQLHGLNYGRILDEASQQQIIAQGHSLQQYDPFLAPNHQALRQSYDFICCYRVLEHFRNPQREWALLCRLLKTGGWLAISTRMLSDDADFGKWHYKNNLAHVAFFHAQTFSYLAEHSGFTLLFAADDFILMQKTSESGINPAL
ncbi:methyltransferase domain-containing protein [Shewanella sp. NIFS-20-20]|uniref:methyltransferase domain-containing protein n=1 Tax=Shewanella sp. NIFS-20-20 TaxID=2853806 RepID=UPI001C48648D|nr:methyltransferase domain-containing protein [Shewanella sp. NIFS-20-20]MBV7316109.1 methyltransferase domain-containing protein [Shewanella sp. NIFS-20-20]